MDDLAALNESIHIEGLASPHFEFIGGHVTALLARIAQLRAHLPACLRARCSHRRFVLMVLVLVYMLAMALVLPLVIGGTGSGRRVSSYASWRVATPGGRVNANASANVNGSKQGEKVTIAVWDRPVHAAEEEAKRIAIEEAPKLAEQRAKAAAREAARQARIAERWANQTAELERREQRQKRKHKSGYKSGGGSRSSSSTRAPLSESSRISGSSASHSMQDFGGGRPPVSAMSWHGPSAEAMEKEAESEHTRLAAQAKCVDGSRARDIFLADALKRRKMAKALALESAVASDRPLFLRMFLANGLFDQIRFLWCAFCRLLPVSCAPLYRSRSVVLVSWMLRFAGPGLGLIAARVDFVADSTSACMLATLVQVCRA